MAGSGWVIMGLRVGEFVGIVEFLLVIWVCSVCFYCGVFVRDWCVLCFLIIVVSWSFVMFVDFIF